MEADYSYLEDLKARVKSKEHSMQTRLADILFTKRGKYEGAEFATWKGPPTPTDDGKRLKRAPSRFSPDELPAVKKPKIGKGNEEKNYLRTCLEEERQTVLDLSSKCDILTQIVNNTMKMIDLIPKTSPLKTSMLGAIFADLDPDSVAPFVKFQPRRISEIQKQEKIPLARFFSSFVRI